jgi:hypothetical protein
MVVQRSWPLVKGNGFILVSELLPGIISASSSSKALYRSKVGKGVGT